MKGRKIKNSRKAQFLRKSRRKNRRKKGRTGTKIAQARTKRTRNKRIKMTPRTMAISERIYAMAACDQKPSLMLLEYTVSTKEAKSLRWKFSTRSGTRRKSSRK
jgi:hypothetical protein